MSPKGYHPYVFDPVARRFVGRFEEMYRAEDAEGFDSWHQDDLRPMSKRMALAILDAYSFGHVLDVGCGKGAFSQFLKKRNNHVVAVDLSETALGIARGRYPDIEFVCGDIGAPAFDWTTLGPGFDLVVALETLSYIERWPAVLAAFGRVARFALIALYLPENPMGFVKSVDHLVEEFQKHFMVIEDIRLQTHRQVVLFGASQSA